MLKNDENNGTEESGLVFPPLGDQSQKQKYINQNKISLVEND